MFLAEYVDMNNEYEYEYAILLFHKVDKFVNFQICHTQIFFTETKFILGLTN